MTKDRNGAKHREAPSPARRDDVDHSRVPSLSLTPRDVIDRLKLLADDSIHPNDDWLSDVEKVHAFGTDLAVLWSNWSMPDWPSNLAVESANVYAAATARLCPVAKFLDGFPLNETGGTWRVPAEKKFCGPVHAALVRSMWLLRRRDELEQLAADGRLLESTRATSLVIDAALLFGLDEELITRRVGLWPALGRAMGELEAEVGRRNRRAMSLVVRKFVPTPPCTRAAMNFVTNHMRPVIELTAEFASLDVGGFPEYNLAQPRPFGDPYKQDRELPVRRRTWWLTLAEAAEQQAEATKKAHEGETPSRNEAAGTTPGIGMGAPASEDEFLVEIDRTAVIFSWRSTKHAIKRDVGFNHVLGLMERPDVGFLAQQIQQFGASSAPALRPETSVDHPADAAAEISREQVLSHDVAVVRAEILKRQAGEAVAVGDKNGALQKASELQDHLSASGLEHCGDGRFRFVGELGEMGEQKAVARRMHEAKRALIAAFPGLGDWLERSIVVRLRGNRFVSKAGTTRIRVRHL